jgi:DNA-binding transcriptional regulator/RsmH inhibitor MraZ
VVVAGVFSRIEVWDSRRWRERDQRGDKSLAESSNLPEFGI